MGPCSQLGESDQQGQDAGRGRVAATRPPTTPAHLEPALRNAHCPAVDARVGRCQPRLTTNTAHPHLHERHSVQLGAFGSKGVL